MAGGAADVIENRARFHLRFDAGGAAAIAARSRQVLQIDGDGFEVRVIYFRGGILHRFGHWARRHGMVVPPGLQIFHDIGLAPGAQACARIAGQVRREPALQRCAGKGRSFVGAEGILGRVTGAAMARAAHQVCAAIPCRALSRIVGIRRRPEEQHVPAAHRKAQVEGKVELVDVDLVLHRLDGLEVFPQRCDIAIAHPRIGRIRHGGI